MKIELPDGGWASLRDPAKVTERQRRPLMRAMGRAGKMETAEDGGAAAVGDVNDTLILALVDSWSLDTPLTDDGLLDLPTKVYDTLSKACLPLVADLMPDFGPTPDPETPSAPSNA